MSAKAWLWLRGGLLLGIAVGAVWRVGSVRSGQSLAEAAAKRASGGGSMSMSGGAANLPRAQQSDHIEVEEDALVRLMAAGRSGAVGMEEMLADTSEGLEAILVIRDWARLDEAKWHRLIELLQQAAKEREAWETSQVRVEAVSGETASWVLHFPADDGQLHAKLMRALETSGFTAEEMEKIELAGDLKNFSYSRFLDLPLVDRAVKVKAQRLDVKGPALFGDYVRFKVAPVPTNNWQEVDLSAEGFEKSNHPSARLVRLLGNPQRVLDEATKAAIAAEAAEAAKVK